MISLLCEYKSLTIDTDKTDLFKSNFVSDDFDQLS